MVAGTDRDGLREIGCEAMLKCISEVRTAGRMRDPKKYTRESSLTANKLFSFYSGSSLLS